MSRYRVKPARPLSGFAFVLNFAALLIGVAVIVPRSPAFGAVWSVAALVATAFYGINFFTGAGVATHEIESDHRPLARAKLSKEQDRL